MILQTIANPEQNVVHLQSFYDKISTVEGALSFLGFVSSL